jgi:hypothetical protein
MIEYLRIPAWAVDHAFGQLRRQVNTANTDWTQTFIAGYVPAVIESGPFRVLAATASVSSGTGRRSVPRLINSIT